MKRYAFGLVALGLMGFAAELKGIPKELSGYENWTVVVKGDLPTNGPHAGTNKVVYANAIAAQNWKSGKALPVGSIVVKTAGAMGAPDFVAEMRKDKTGWYYVEFASKGGRYGVMGGGDTSGNMGQTLCSGCHGQAKGQDYLFTRK